MQDFLLCSCSSGRQPCSNCSNNPRSQRKKSQTSKSSQLRDPSDEVQELDNDYKTVFMRRLTSDMESEGIQPNDLRRRFGLTKETLENLLPEYKLLLNRYDLNLYRYAQEVLTIRYLHRMHIDSETVQTSSTSHTLVEVESQAADVAEHGQHWREVNNQRLHKASRSQLDSVMELIRVEDRPVTAFNEGENQLSASSEAEGDPVTNAGGGGGSGLSSGGGGGTSDGAGGVSD